MPSEHKIPFKSSSVVRHLAAFREVKPRETFVVSAIGYNIYNSQNSQTRSQNQSRVAARRHPAHVSQF